MFHGKKKAVTFSYDDGPWQDRRLTALLDRYGLKGTFHLNSGSLGRACVKTRGGVSVRGDKPSPTEIVRIYRGHEVAAHTVDHPFLPSLDDEEIVRQVEEDRRVLSELVGYEVVGLSYPCGGASCDARVARLVREHTGIRYARTVDSRGDFMPPEDRYVFRPTAYHAAGWDALEALARRFLEDASDTPRLFCLWGHGYELDFMNAWNDMESLCRLLSGHDDVFYGTCREVLLAD